MFPMAHQLNSNTILIAINWAGKQPDPITWQIHIQFIKSIPTYEWPLSCTNAVNTQEDLLITILFKHRWKLLLYFFYCYSSIETLILSHIRNCLNSLVAFIKGIYKFLVRYCRASELSPKGKQCSSLYMFILLKRTKENFMFVWLYVCLWVCCMYMISFF